MSQSLTVNANSEPYADLPPMCVALFEAKAKKGATFDQIAKAIGRDEVWVAAMFYGQAKLSEEELAKLSQFLEIPHSDLAAELGANWWPRRGLGPMPPTDPVLYRLYEGVLVYGNAIKAVVHEKFGDGIMSMIDCKVNVERKPDPKGDRVLLIFDGKFLPYLKW
ncbi:cyanate lyase C-terminal domain-containing protein [Fomitopsis serialis]|uniref:cyanate lyase C-terminal domain-containing protein n=1 Tax=Fomitopsis serialis TaxID=139415 RepID=UPI002008C915|nr:cyanate lyase C-terminal domain-containing protein [Neoantrodia serialis]KAH9917027.1 cyanate lyase C-terminal domain-containing protein [Neoantrodia serialis]